MATRKSFMVLLGTVIVGALKGKSTVKTSYKVGEEFQADPDEVAGLVEAGMIAEAETVKAEKGRKKDPETNATVIEAAVRDLLDPEDPEFVPGLTDVASKIGKPVDESVFSLVLRLIASEIEHAATTGVPDTLTEAPASSTGAA